MQRSYIGLLVVVLVQGIYAMNDQLDKVNRVPSSDQKCSLKTSSDKITPVIPTAPIQIIISAAAKHKLSSSSETLAKATIKDYASFPHSHDNSPTDTRGDGNNDESSPHAFHHSFYGNYGNGD